MRTNRVLLAAAAMALSAAAMPMEGGLSNREREGVRRREKARKAPPPPPPPAPNLPGETNRQFAARMKAEAADQRNDEAWEPQEDRASLVQGRAAA